MDNCINSLLKTSRIWLFMNNNTLRNVGGNRDMSRRYQDAMTVCQKLGKPTYFVTMTCNPAWPEIQAACAHSNQKAIDRPDITARVFALKLQELRDDLYKKHVLGRAIAYLDVIEFQKRGLPHAHILLILSSADSLLTSDTVDDVATAAFPIAPTPDVFGSDTRGQSDYAAALHGHRRLNKLVCDTMLHREHLTGAEAVCSHLSSY